MIQSSPPALEIDQLTKRFGTRQALRGISFRLEAGERLAFLGPNGAGKTTLIRAIAARTSPTGGSIKIFGQAPDDSRTHQLIGFVPQDIALYGDLTARQNLKAFGRFYGLKGTLLRERLTWALEWTGLADRANELVRNFSGGMKRRINIACGVLHRPKLILLDEPTVGVDPQSREHIFGMLDKLNDAGTAILLTTHNLDEAQSRSDRIVVIDHGSIVADGTFSELVQETVGNSRLVKVRLDKPLSRPIELTGMRTTLEERVVGQSGEQLIHTRLSDVNEDLGRLVQLIKRNGYQVADLEIRSPSLSHVFLHLTGQDLRD